MKCTIQEFYLDQWFNAEGDKKSQEFIMSIWGKKKEDILSETPLRVSNRVITKKEISKYRKVEEIKMQELPLYIADAQKKHPNQKMTIFKCDFIKKKHTAYRIGDLVFTITMEIDNINI